MLDQRRAAELTLRHLYQLGHRNIAFMRGGSHSSDADERWDCLKDRGQRIGAWVRPELTVELKLRVSTPELGYGPAQRTAQSRRDFTAIVCYNDVAAIGAIRALRDHGLRVPEDISVVGFDDIQSAAFNNPSLTTIRQPLHEMGTIAARILLQRVRGQNSVPQMLPVLPELVIRESTCPPPEKLNRTKRG